MSKMLVSAMLAASAAGSLLVPATAHGAILGPAAALCDSNATAVLVEVRGFKARTGTLRVQIYKADDNYLEKGKYLERIDLPVTASGNMHVCMPVKQPGSYVVSVRHDLNGNGKSDLKDGGGMSGNPKLSASNFISKKKPPLSAVSFAVGASTRQVPVTLNYVQGFFSVKPVE